MLGVDRKFEAGHSQHIGKRAVMQFVRISRVQKNVPSDIDITAAMTAVNGTVARIERDDSAKVYFTGVVNDNRFENKLQELANGNGQSWEFAWGDGIGQRLFPLNLTRYAINIHNDSDLDDNYALVFQTLPKQPDAVHSLSWLSEMCHKHSRVKFGWAIEYNFVWGKTGILKPGVDYEAGATTSADLNANNLITLEYVKGGFEFGDVSNTIPGTLVIHQDASVPGAGDDNQGNVGIGMSNAGTFVKPTQKNYTLEFEPHPMYWIAFGEYEAGSVVDESGMTNPQQVEFGEHTTADCTYNGTKWSIKYS